MDDCPAGISWILSWYADMADLYPLIDLYTSLLSCESARTSSMKFIEHRNGSTSLSRHQLDQLCPDSLEEIESVLPEIESLEALSEMASAVKTFLKPSRSPRLEFDFVSKDLFFPKESVHNLLLWEIRNYLLIDMQQH